jgi:hypothetical protein
MTAQDAKALLTGMLKAQDKYLRALGRIARQPLGNRRGAQQQLRDEATRVYRRTITELRRSYGL